MIKVSVVIPFYKYVNWLMEAVESVLQQDYSNIEIIVVNDGSPEDVSEFLEKYGKKIIYERKVNGGAATARNRGIELASGEYIAFLDSDDIWCPSKISVQIELMERYKAVWSYCDYSTFGNGQEKKYSMTNAGNVIFQRYYSPHIATPCVVIRKNYLDQHPECYFHPQLRYGQDVYMWLTINAFTPILAIPQELVKVRIRGTNAARRAKVQLQARSNIWKCRKQNKELLIDKYNISYLFKAASELCTFGNVMVNSISRMIKNEKVVEFISRCFFVTPWMLFKIDRIFDKRKRKNV